MDSLRTIMLWVVVSEGVIFTLLVLTLLWLICNTSTNCTIQFGFTVLFSAIVVFIDGTVGALALKTNMREIFLLALFAALISFLIFAITIIMNLIIAVTNLIAMSMMDEQESFDKHNEDILPNYVFFLLLTVFGFALIALLNLVTILTLMPLLFPDNNLKLISFPMGT